MGVDGAVKRVLPGRVRAAFDPEGRNVKEGLLAGAIEMHGWLSLFRS